MQLPAADRANRPKIQMHAKKILELPSPLSENLTPSSPFPKSMAAFHGSIHQT